VPSAIPYRDLRDARHGHEALGPIGSTSDLGTLGSTPEFSVDVQIRDRQYFQSMDRGGAGPRVAPP
jgi:hypothetical protein